MAIREDLVNNAVAFLVDPQVADKPLAKKIEFLESKELSAEEIEAALARAKSGAAASASSVATSQEAAAPSYVAYQRPAPPVPGRDWRDYFVMATVTGGVAYGLYEVARRYVVPLIVPPTPSSLEADKAALEAEFARQEALIEQLQRDTEEIKKAELQRSEQYDQVLNEAREAVRQIKEHASQRENDIANLRTQVEVIKDTLPKSLEKQRGLQDKALVDLQNELKSLKQLLSIRLKSNSSSLPPIPPASSVPSFTGAAPRSSSPESPLAASTSSINGSTSGYTNGSASGSAAVAEPDLPDPAADLAQSSGSSSSFPAPAAVQADKPKSSIPAWQLAASRAG